MDPYQLCSRGAVPTTTGLGQYVHTTVTEEHSQSVGAEMAVARAADRASAGPHAPVVSMDASRYTPSVVRPEVKSPFGEVTLRADDLDLPTRSTRSETVSPPILTPRPSEPIPETVFGSGADSANIGQMQATPSGQIGSHTGESYHVTAESRSSSIIQY